jgi:predicted ATP-binding protein involved in virulence
MRIDQLTVRNFKGFEERVFDLTRSPTSEPGNGSFHVLIGENGSGKTSALDALAVALGIWHVAAPTAGWRNIDPEAVRLIERRTGDTSRFDPAPSAEIEARGLVAGEQVTWKRMIRKGGKRTTNAEAKRAIELIKRLTSRKEDTALPVLAYYGAGRAWLPTRERSAGAGPSMAKRSRFDAYYNCLDGRIRDRELNEWFMWERLAAAENGEERASYRVVKQAILSCVPGSQGLRFDVDRKEIVVTLGASSIPFYSLSDGQRTTVSMIADLAIKAVLLNPHFGDEAALRSPGVVLIDELDLHLHPKWQRRIVEDLRQAFPAMQFVGTTHSPFIIQSLRPGELLPLDGQPVQEPGNLGIETIARGLMGVSRPDVGIRYAEMVDAAKEYLLTLEEAALAPDEKLAEYEKRLAERVEPYADNPAFQAFLELKHEGKLGGRLRRDGAPSSGEEKSLLG